MQQIPVDTLYEGLVYSAPIYMDDEVMLVPAGMPIKRRDLAQLKSFGIKNVLSDGRPAAKMVETKAAPPTKAAPSAKAAPPAKADVTKPAAGVKAAVGERPLPQAGAQPQASPAAPEGSPAVAAEVAAEGAPAQNAATPSALEVYKKINSVVAHLDGIFKEIAAGANNPAEKTRLNTVVRQLWQITSALIQLSQVKHSECLSFILAGALKDGYELAKSSVNTAIIAAIIAKEMGAGKEALTEITASALLHDIGMLRLPQDVVNKAKQLSPEEITVIQSHTAISHYIIRQELLYSDAVAVAALQHHERWDGTGYPHRLAGAAISEAARIICIADAFEAMVCKKPYRSPMIGYQAMRTLVSSNTAHFSPDILKVFVKVMGIYPIGSGVALNDGRIGQVVDFHGDAPLRPTVKVLALSGAKKVKDGELVNLLEQKKCYITQAIDLAGFF